MQVSTFLIAAALLHVLLLVTDVILKSCLCLPYLHVVEQLGLVIKPLQVRISTALLNRPLSKLSFKLSSFTQLWISVGVWVSLVSMVPSVMVLVYNALQWLIVSLASAHKSSSNPTDVTHAPPVLQPVVPGINLSAEELPVYVFTLLVSSVLHEAGHAVAALREGVHVDGVGLILLYIFPGAFVLLPPDAMAAVRPFAKLKILCAGVWNNMALAVGALLLAHLLPSFSVLAYTSGHGAVVTKVFENSPARGTRGLYAEEVIQNINGCAVKDSLSFHNCLLQALTERQRGSCVSDTVVSEMDETVQHAMVGPDGAVTCCRKARQDTPGVDHLCFELLSDGNGPDAGQTPMHPYSCLPARPALSRSPLSCRDTSECPSEHYCLAPSVGADERLLRISRISVAELRSGSSVLKENERLFGERKLAADNRLVNYHSSEYMESNLTQTSFDDSDEFTVEKPEHRNVRKLQSSNSKDKILPDIHRSSNEQEKAMNEAGDYVREIDDGHTDDMEALPSFTEVLYLGSPALLYQTITVSDYVPRRHFISYGWVEELQEICLCFVKFSGALAVLNLIPCLGFDGQHIVDTLIDWCCADSLARSSSKLLKGIVTAVGTLLVVFNIFIGILSLSFTEAAKKAS